jgi:2-C-methyl-D-erythritol 4-phosphate cytidylyltransferase/2-C-methyl-D-erythritol 2,4-cyclodiphosphate synthase
LTRVCALIPAAGRGARFGGSENKIFAPILGRPLLAWTLEAFARCEAVESVLLVGNAADLPRLREISERWGGGKVRGVAPGGEDRQASVAEGLAAADAPLVVVHDAARPCVTGALIEATLRAANEAGAATAALPVADTLVREAPDHCAGEIVERAQVWAVQTPQAFQTELLREAHARPGAPRATDDAALVRRLGRPVKLVEGEPSNLKVTRPEDRALAEAILARREAAPPPVAVPPALRIGQGYDVHPFAPGRRLVLGGVEFPDAGRGLLGHSDADVLLHAVCDALLGAAGQGDIGALFPDNDPVNKDRSSLEFLRVVRARLDGAGWGVANVDVTVLAEAPRIGPSARAIRESIAGALGISPDRVGIKATTAEGLGFVGRGEGIAVHATALIYGTGGGLL